MAWNDNLQPGSRAYAIAASQHSRIRVLAGPGTGKSFAMKRRVARILEVDQIDPWELLAVTFTRVAAEDLHRELVTLGVPGAELLSGRTLHGLAMTILMRNHVLQTLGRRPRPLNEFELEPLLADLSRDHGKKAARKKLIRAYGAAWARLQTEEPGFAREPTEQAFVDELVDWLTIHEAMLLDEIIPHLFQYLRLNPGAPEHSEFAHVLIDEYQDLNRAEQAVLQYLGAQGSICVIGDDDQSIYSFKHAHPAGIRDWHTLQPTDMHSIDECRRCPTTVVRMANALIARNTDRIGGRQLTERATNGPGMVAIHQFSTAAQEADAVAHKIHRLIQNSVAPEEIIVLAQRATFAAGISQRLRDHNVPVKSYYAEAELDTLDAQERFAILKLFLNNEDRVALRWLLGRHRTDWHAKAYGRLLAWIRENGSSPWQILTRLANGEIQIPFTGPLIKRFLEIRDEINQLAEAADILDFITAWLPENPETQHLAETVNKSREGVLTPRELYETLYELITQPEIPLEVIDVRVMSFHKSKGLNSPYVFIVGCVEGLLPASPDLKLPMADRVRKLQEDRRLFYVGITRVKSHLPDKVGYLALTYAQSMPVADALGSQITPVAMHHGVAYLQASRFIGEMAPHAPASQLNTQLL